MSVSSIVSVRMPKSLIDTLKEYALRDHFMDLSEELRFIIKQKMIEQIDPYAYQLKKLKDEIKSEMSSKNKIERTRFIKELRLILDELKNE